MAELLLPPWIIPEEETHEWLDEGSSVFSAAFAPGLAQRQSFGGLRLKLSRRHTVRLEEKAQLLSILKATRGRFNALRTKVHFAFRGSFPSSELVSNNTFQNGTTGFTAGSETAMSASDRLLRLNRAAVTSTQDALSTTGASTVVEFAPYIARAFLLPGRGSYSTFKATIGSTQGGNDFGSGIASSAYGNHQVAGVATGTSGYLGIEELAASGLVAGDFFSTSYVSLARCALVDNGANMLLQSDEFDTTWTTGNATVDDQTGAVVAPDGTSTADALEENTTNGFHYVQQAVPVSATAGDYAFGVAIRAGSRAFAFMELSGSAGSATVYVNINGVAVGSTSVGTGWSTARAFVVNAGNGWVIAYIVARKTNSDTSITARVGSATALGTGSYAGVNGDDAIYLWRGTLAQSSLPTRLIQTTAAATTGTSQTGNGLHLKGLPASTSGLVLPDDWSEINGELKSAIAPLNSDAAGLGYWQFEPSLGRYPADNDPVITTDPMGKFLVSNIKIDNEFGTQAIVTYDLEHVYE